MAFLLITLSIGAFAVSITRNGSDITVTFDAVQGDTYRLEQKNALTDPDWQQIAGVGDFFAGNTGPAQITDPNALSLTHAFYQVAYRPELTVTIPPSPKGQ